MKSVSFFYKLLIISLLAMMVSPSPSSVFAEPSGPDAPDANGSLWEPIIVFPSGEISIS